MKSYFSWFMAVLWTSSWLINETEKYHHAIIVLYILTLVDIPACCVARTLSSNIFVLVCIKINVFLSLNVLDMTPHPKYNVIFLHQHHILFEKIIILFEKQYIGWVSLQFFFKICRALTDLFWKYSIQLNHIYIDLRKNWIASVTNGSPSGQHIKTK